MLATHTRKCWPSEQLSNICPNTLGFAILSFAHLELGTETFLESTEKPYFLKLTLNNIYGIDMVK